LIPCRSHTHGTADGSDHGADDDGQKQNEPNSTCAKKRCDEPGGRAAKSAA
jgi:hypothetical protein